MEHENDEDPEADYIVEDDSSDDDENDEILDGTFRWIRILAIWTTVYDILNYVNTENKCLVWFIMMLHICVCLWVCLYHKGLTPWRNGDVPTK